MGHTYTWASVSKHTFGHVRPKKIQISLRIRAILSDPSLGADNGDCLDCTGAQADLSHCLVDMSEGTFSHAVTKMR